MTNDTYTYRDHEIEKTPCGYLVRRGAAYLHTTHRYEDSPDKPNSSAYWDDDVAVEQAINRVMQPRVRRAKPGIHHKSKLGNSVIMKSKAVQQAERNAIVDALRKHAWRRTPVADELGITRVTLYNWMKKLGITEEIDAEVVEPGKAPEQRSLLEVMESIDCSLKKICRFIGMEDERITTANRNGDSV